MDTDIDVRVVKNNESNDMVIVTHIPSGVTVEVDCYSTQYQCYQAALKQLNIEMLERDLPWIKQLVTHSDPQPHISVEDLKLHMPGELKADFSAWLVGQTVIQRQDGYIGVYRWDFDRWVEEGMKKDQGANWD